MKEENSLSSLIQQNVPLSALVSALVLGVKLSKYFNLLTVESGQSLVLVEKMLYM